MREIGSALRIKYKLMDVPTEEQAAEWAKLVDAYRGEGHDIEEAGQLAAEQLFRVEPNLILKAEADTIEALLDQAKKK